MTPALDEALLEMSRTSGGRSSLEGQQAYGRSGFYSREKPGEKRFVISPNTTLVYDVEVLSVARK